VIFGEAEQSAVGTQDGVLQESLGMSMADPSVVAASEPNGDQAFRPEPGSTAGDDGNGWQRGRRRSRGNRHSDPPPAVG